MAKTTALQALGTLLEASADDRTLTYRLLPYGEQGRTNLGRVTAGPGVVRIPGDPSELVANLEHDRKRPVARATSITEDDGGLTATFRIAATTAGNDLLAEAAEGLRTGISVELSDPVIRNGKLLSAELAGAGFVASPAFPSAQLVAADAGELPDEIAPDSQSHSVSEDVIEVDGKKYRRITESSYETRTEPVAGNDDDPPDGGDEDTEDDASEEDQEDQQMTASTAKKAASAPATLRGAAAKGGGRGTTLLAADAGPRDLFRLLAEAGKTQDSELIAELVDITQSGAIGNTEVPQYVGELWDGRAAERRIIPLFNHADLTSYKVHGWRWVNKPQVAPYAGDKADVPSNAVSTEQVTISAERIAGAHDIDRKYRDFGDEAFWQSYLAAMTESYAVQSDAAVLADALAAATAVTVGDPVTGVPAVWIKIVDGVLSVLQATNAMPSFSVLAFDLYRDFLLTPQDGGLEYLNAALGFERGTVNQGNFSVLPHAAIPDGGALTGAREAVTVHELGGGTPIRVEAENVGKGGIDAGVFGYYAVNIHDTGGLALVNDPITP
ncbi:hypothetical protein [Jiangella gansuensis]|uniref:phage major capsid protein n=1 Tax=Jiangella gansuensis TaxID=281473 RepID=UPI0004795115|nr:hypothetical protein [Jiangella gansuensis]